jgi:hypothetical protein
MLVDPERVAAEIDAAKAFRALFVRREALLFEWR